MGAPIATSVSLDVRRDEAEPVPEATRVHFPARSAGHSTYPGRLVGGAPVSIPHIPNPAADGGSGGDGDMFENVGSLSASAGRPNAALSLESLEDRTTPAVAGTAVVGTTLIGSAPVGTNIVGTATVNAAALNAVSLSASDVVDREFLAESARLSLMEAWLGTVEATRGADPQIRQVGLQLATEQLNALNTLLPGLTRNSLGLQLSAFDVQTMGILPNLSASATDSQFLALSTMDALQIVTLSRTEATSGSDPTLRAFAQEQLFAVEQELLVEVTLLGPTGASATLGLFSLLGGFNAASPVGAPGTNGFGVLGISPTTGFVPSNTTGIGLTGASGPAAFGTTGASGPNAFGATGASGPDAFA